MDGDRFEEIARPIEAIITAFADHGSSLYLVGGVVRDTLLGSLDPSDVDLTTDAEPETITALIAPHTDALWDQGARFGTIAARVGDEIVEITTHRAETYESESRKPVVGFGDDILADLARRDFTINAMAFDLIGQDGLVDPFGGQADLERHRLRTPQEPAVSFDDDPLRMLRAARFAARFDLEVDPSLISAMKSRASRMSIVSIERQRDEIERLLELDNMADALGMLGDVGLDRIVFAASVAELVGFNWSAIETIDLRRLVLFDSLGDVSAQMRRFRYSNATVAEAVLLSAIVEALTSRNGAWTDPDVRRLALGAPTRARAVAAMVAICWPESSQSSADQFVAALDELTRREDLEDDSVPLSGRDVMVLLGIEEGAAIGDALRYLRERRIEDGPMDRATAEALLRTWAG